MAVGAASTLFFAFAREEGNSKMLFKMWPGLHQIQYDHDSVDGYLEALDFWPISTVNNVRFPQTSHPAHGRTKEVRLPSMTSPPLNNS